MPRCRRAIGCTLVFLLSLAACPHGAIANEPAAQVSTCRQIKAWLRAKLVRQKDLARFGIKVDESAAQADASRQLVILVHGFNSTPKRTAVLLAQVREAGIPCGSFSYPNDQPLADSARLLSRELVRLRAERPGQKVALVSYSMGSLVARACVEDPALDPGNVGRLVMVAPPNHGTRLARFAVGCDLWEHVFCGEGNPLARARASIADGLAEAADDLRPGSAFLAELNARPRNEHVHYSILLGTGAAVSPSEWAAFRRLLLKSGGRIPYVKRAFYKLDKKLADADEIIAGRGDGVVAVSRGRLAGVEDTLLLDFGHMGVCGQDDGRPTHQVQRAVLARLQSAD